MPRPSKEPILPDYYQINIRPTHDFELWDINRATISRALHYIADAITSKPNGCNPPDIDITLEGEIHVRARTIDPNIKEQL